MTLIIEQGDITEVHALPIIVILEYPNTDMVQNKPFSIVFCSSFFIAFRECEKVSFPRGKLTFPTCANGAKKPALNVAHLRGSAFFPWGKLSKMSDSFAISSVS